MLNCFLSNIFVLEQNPQTFMIPIYSMISYKSLKIGNEVNNYIFIMLDILHK